MGDASFWWRLQDMASGEDPLIVTEEGGRASSCHTDFLKTRLTLTQRGQFLLNGRVFWKNPNPSWIGGCDFRAHTWLWSEQTRQFSKD